MGAPRFAGVQRPQRTSSPFAFDHHHETPLYPVEVREIEAIEELGQPPRRRLLYQMGIAPVGQDLLRRVGVHRKYADIAGE